MLQDEHSMDQYREQSWYPQTQNNFDTAIKSSGTFEIDVIYKYCLDNKINTPAIIIKNTKKPIKKIKDCIS